MLKLENGEWYYDTKEKVFLRFAGSFGLDMLERAEERTGLSLSRRHTFGEHELLGDKISTEYYIAMRSDDELNNLIKAKDKFPDLKYPKDVDVTIERCKIGGD